MCFKERFDACGDGEHHLEYASNRHVSQLQQKISFVSPAVTGNRCMSDWQKEQESSRSNLAKGRNTVTKLQIDEPWKSELIYQMDDYWTAMDDSFLCASALHSDLESALTVGHHESFNASLATKYYYDLSTDSTTLMPDLMGARKNFVLSAKSGFESLREVLTQPLESASRCEAALSQADLEKQKLILCVKKVYGVVDRYHDKTFIE
jgi:hypothetical protein